MQNSSHTSVSSSSLWKSSNCVGIVVRFLGCALVIGYPGVSCSRCIMLATLTYVRVFFVDVVDKRCFVELLVTISAKYC